MSIHIDAGSLKILEIGYHILNIIIIYARRDSGACLAQRSSACNHRNGKQSAIIIIAVQRGVAVESENLRRILGIVCCLSLGMTWDY